MAVILLGAVAASADAAEPVLCNGAVATIVGTSGPDVLRGTDGDDVIAALGGPDVVSGLDGDDVVCGGGGPDVLRGDGGVDLLLGDGGPDVAIGGSGDDNCSAEVARCENAGDASSAIDLEIDLQGDRFESPSIFNQYVYTINNRGATRTGHVVVTDTLPVGITYESVASPGDLWDCTLVFPAPTPGRQTVSCRYELRGHASTRSDSR